MKNLFLTTVLSLLVCGQAFAYVQIDSCSNDMKLGEAGARAADKRTKITIITSYLNSAPEPKKNFERMSMYRDWILGQLNTGTLLREQLAGEIERVNNIRSESTFVDQKEKDGSPCRQMVFSKSDIQPLGFIWTSPSELIVSFNVLMTYVLSRRDEGTVYGHRFNMKVSITQEYTNHNYPVVGITTVTEYPQFILKDYGSYPEEN